MPRPTGDEWSLRIPFWHASFRSECPLTSTTRPSKKNRRGRTDLVEGLRHLPFIPVTHNKRHGHHRILLPKALLSRQADAADAMTTTTTKKRRDRRRSRFDRVRTVTPTGGHTKQRGGDDAGGSLQDSWNRTEYSLLAVAGRDLL